MLSLRSATMAIASLSAIALLVGCTSAGESPAPSTSQGQTSEEAPADDVELTVTIWSNAENQLAALNERADAFVEASPTVSKVTFESIAYAEYDQQVATRLSGANAPDAGWIVGDSANTYLSAGALLDLSEAMKTTEWFNLDDVLAETLEPWQDGDAIYGSPFSQQPEIIYYNIDALTAAGVPTPQDYVDEGNWNMDSLAELSEQAAKAPGVKAGFTIHEWDWNTNWTKLWGIWAAFGARPFSADGTECEFETPEMRESLEYLHDLTWNRGGMALPGVSVDFFAGEAALAAAFPNRASLLKDATFQWGVAPVPEGPAGWHPVHGQAVYTAFAKSSHPEEAKQFALWMSSPESTESLLSFWQGARTSVLTVDTIAAAYSFLDDEHAQAIAELIISGLPGQAQGSLPVNGPLVRQVVGQELDALWVETPDFDAVTANVCAAYYAAQQ